MNTLKKISTLIALILITSSLSAQEFQRERTKDRVEAELIGHLTQRLELTPEQAQTFFPLYREHKEQEKELRKSLRSKRHYTDLTEEESEALLAEMIEVEDRMHDLKRSYHTRYREVLSARQMIALRSAEREFKERLIKNISDRRRKEAKRKRFRR